VAALAKDGPVYGIDMPGDANPSVPRAPMTPPASCAAWLDELLGQLSGRPLLVVALHQRPGHPHPDAAAPPPRPVAGPSGHAAPGADDAHVGRHPRLPCRAQVPRRPHRRRTPRDHRASPAGHRSAQRPHHPGPGPRPGKPHAARGSRCCPRQPRRLQPDRRAERPDRRLHQRPGHGQAGRSTGTSASNQTVGPTSAASDGMTSKAAAVTAIPAGESPGLAWPMRSRMRLVDELAQVTVDPATSGPLPGREDEWAMLADYRAEIAQQDRDWPTMEQILHESVNWHREQASPALAASADDRDRSNIDSLAAAILKLANALREQEQPGCVQPYLEAMGLFNQIADR